MMCLVIEDHHHIAGTDGHCVIPWDNLRAHMTSIIYQTIETWDGSTVFSSLHWPA